MKGFIMQKRMKEDKMVWLNEMQESRAEDLKRCDEAMGSCGRNKGSLSYKGFESNSYKEVLKNNLREETQRDGTSHISPTLKFKKTDYSSKRHIMGVKFPNIQSKPPLAQLEAISSCPITFYLGEETDPHLSTTSFQAKQSQLPQPLLIRLLLQTLHQLCCPSLDTLQHLNVPLVVGGPKLNTGFKVRPHQCRVQGHDRFPSPAGHAIFDTSQDAIGFLGHLGTLLAHIQAAVNKHSQVLLCQAAFQPQIVPCQRN
ncbi:hypothetical protein QYF61_007889 [Mycteria americana]|uniref:Uncharacterized protein n=1 Tax=Mycteria americana TaxID=33587 RepID=A0AAN7N7L3_MYCAM|nr:hypothetical protein QYF61_007889 [Mycteria americana]